MDTSLPVKAVLFDLDDTLWPIVPVIHRAEIVLHDWLATHAPDVAKQFSVEAMRARRMELMAANPRYRIDLSALRHAALSEAFLACGEDVTKVDAAMKNFSQTRNTVTPYEDVLPTLAYLSSVVKVGSISNGAADLEAIGLARHFHVSIAAHQHGRAKPEASIFHTACDALQVLPAEAVYVGDDPVLDVEGAQRAGLRGIWMKRNGIEPVRTLPDHIRPDAICQTLYELDHWLAGRIIKTA
ncbi:MAG TPA: HAD family hydrolase [Burkholderiaceae bacterium]|nr:HAD family hydrolase [Burkholderiaceae bacterium]